MKTTTLERIRAHCPCDTGWKQLLRHLGKTQADDEPLSFATILASNGLDDALWCVRVEPQYDSEWRLMACAFAREVAYLNPDPRVMNCIEVAERFARGEASEAELRDARDGADKAASRHDYAAFAAQCAAYCAAGLAATAARTAALAGAKQKEIFLQFVA